jgi:murein DD-endopeptidase MepM/ murein hydrolase activator NlpD
MIIEPLHLELEPRRPESSARYLVRPSRNFRDVLKAVGIEPPMAPAANPPSHTVKRGDNLWNISAAALKAQGAKPSRHDIHVAVLAVAKANGLSNPDLLAVGQKLDLSAVGRFGGPTAFRSSVAESVHNAGPAGKSAPATVVEGTVRAPANTPPTAMAQTAKPEPKIESVAPATAPLASTVTDSAGQISADARGGPSLTPRSDHPHAGSRLRFPQAAHPQSNTEPAPSSDSIDLTALIQSILEPGSVTLPDAASKGPWGRVLDGPGRFTSGFGIRKDPFTGRRHFHHGIDIAAAPGTVIRPMHAGVVKSSGWEPGHGKVVVIQHPDGLETLYAHASELLVKAGDVVTKETPIAKVGSTGRSTGAHLHFEARRNDKAVDPLPLFRDDSLHIAKAP